MFILPGILVLNKDKGRTKTATYSDGTVLSYAYTGDGQLHSVRQTRGENVTDYLYQYDSLGNLVGSEKFVGGLPMLRTWHSYDNDNRLSSQGWQIGTDSFSQTYSYDTWDGNLSSMQSATGQTLTYTYTGDGQLYSITAVEDEDETKYLYNYDSLGRLIYSERKDDGATVLRARQGYDDVGRLITQTWQVGNETYTEGFTYNSTQDGSLNTHSIATGDTLTYGYDELRRLSTVSGSVYDKSYTYRDITTTETTNQVAGLVYDLPTDQSFGYTYDNMGNIATYTDANGTVTYTYDALGQLTKAEGSTTYEYSYDNAGNILSANGHTYTYGDSTWADLLTAVDGHAITYDPAGNPTSYYNGTNWTFTWEHGRNLGTATDGTNTIGFTYDVDGLRTSKTVNGTKHTYYYAGGTLLRETYGNDTLDFFYVGGVPYAFKYNGTLYYYITNLQGDVMSIVDGAGNELASYQYDPYGNVVSATGPLAEINPLRYRGYYYDAEMGMYYLQSRYYDPEICRFINADALVSIGQGILGNNMFAYCGNSPIALLDTTGRMSQFCVRSDSNGGGSTKYKEFEKIVDAYAATGIKLYSTAWAALMGWRSKYLPLSETYEHAAYLYCVDTPLGKYYYTGKTYKGSKGSELISPNVILPVIVLEISDFLRDRNCIAMVHTHPDPGMGFHNDYPSYDSNLTGGDLIALTLFGYPDMYVIPYKCCSETPIIVSVRDPSTWCPHYSPR